MSDRESMEYDVVYCQGARSCSVLAMDTSKSEIILDISEYLVFFEIRSLGVLMLHTYITVGAHYGRLYTCL